MPPLGELYVYYRVRSENAAAALAEVRRFQGQLREAQAGLQARLLRRPGVVDGVQTWMETYACPALDADAADRWQAGIEASAAGLASLIDGARHVEVFEPVPDAVVPSSPP